MRTEPGYVERLLCFGPEVPVRASVDHVDLRGGGRQVGLGRPGDTLIQRRLSVHEDGPGEAEGGTAVCDRPGDRPADALASAAEGGGWHRAGLWSGLPALKPGEAHGHLKGTLTLPVPMTSGRPARAKASPASAGRAGVLLLNAGIIGRGGPHRFNVKLARRVACLGLPALRFDLSGHGDSGPAPGVLGYHEQSLADLRAAVDCLCATGGVQRVVIVGICSGAQAGWHAALEDPRIVGLAMLDGHAYPSPITWLLHRWQRMRARRFPEQIQVLGAACGRSLRRVLGRPATEQGRSIEEASQPGLGAADRLPVQLRTETEYAQGMESLTARGVRSLIVYSCGWMAFYSYAAQYRHVFGRHRFAREVKLLFAPELDHTLTLVESQEAVSDWIESWLAEVGMLPDAKEGR